MIYVGSAIGEKARLVTYEALFNLPLSIATSSASEKMSPSSDNVVCFSLQRLIEKPAGQL